MVNLLFFLLLLLLKGCTCNNHFIKIPESQHSPHLFTTTCKHTDKVKQTRTLYIPNMGLLFDGKLKSSSRQFSYIQSSAFLTPARLLDIHSNPQTALNCESQLKSKSWTETLPTVTVQHLQFIWPTCFWTLGRLSVENMQTSHSQKINLSLERYLSKGYFFCTKRVHISTLKVYINFLQSTATMTAFVSIFLRLTESPLKIRTQTSDRPGQCVLFLFVYKNVF